LVGIRKAALDQAQLEKTPPRALRFLEDHADWTVRVLNLDDVQLYLSMILEREGMDEASLPDVLVMVFPYPHESREAPIAHGSYMPGLRQIRIYPGLASYKGLEGMTDPQVKVFQEVIADGDSGIRFAQRHILTVIHELLHVKYGHDEALVDEKSEEYLKEFFVWLRGRTTVRVG
jgi:hypothetical protein